MYKIRENRHFLFENPESEHNRKQFIPQIEVADLILWHNFFAYGGIYCNTIKSIGMKKTLLGLAIAATAMAISPEAFPRQASHIANPAGINNVVHKADASSRISGEEIIYDAPEGDKKSYYRNGQSYTLNIDWDNMAMVLGLYEDQYVVGDVVEGTDGFYYFRNPVMGISTSSYMKGEREGDEIVFRLPQPIIELEGLVVGVSKMKIVDDEFFGVSAEVVKDNNEIRFSVNEDGSYTQIEEDGYLMGYYYMDDYTWTYMGTASQTYYPFDKKPVEIPSTAEIQEGQMIYGGNGVKVRFAVSGDKFYLGDIWPNLEGGWAVGSIDGDKVSFDSYQLLGASEQDYHYVFFVGAKIEDIEKEEYADALPSMSFIYDEARSTLTPEYDDEAIVVNASAKEIYWLAYYENPVIGPFQLQPATPRDPEIISYQEEWDYGYSSLNFKLSTLSTDGNLLDAGHYYYNIYLDDEVLVLYPDEYETITDIIENVPYDFSDDESITFNNGTHTFTVYSEGYEDIGVQAIYEVDNVENRSKVVYYYSTDVRVAGVGSGDIESETYYDLTGRKVAAPANGIFIKKTTFTDGSSKVTKTYVR